MGFTMFCLWQISRKLQDLIFEQSLLKYMELTTRTKASSSDEYNWTVDSNYEFNVNALFSELNLLIVNSGGSVYAIKTRKKRSAMEREQPWTNQEYFWTEYKLPSDKWIVFQYSSQVRVHSLATASM